MLDSKARQFEEYLSLIYKKDVRVSRFFPLGMRRGPKTKGDLKGFGYATPCVIEFIVNGETKHVIMETARSEDSGRDYFSEGAGSLLWQHSAFNKLPKHAHSIDVGSFTMDGESIKSLGDCREFFIVTEYIDGQRYKFDLDRIKEIGQLNKIDEQRCLALSDYLVMVHKVKRDAPWLYAKGTRELFGHSECIMGLLDSYPSELELISESNLINIEQNSVIWRWRLKRKTHRLSQIHGNFHPWNVIFCEDTEFKVVNRSRSEWGEPADDVAAMSTNYIFYSLQKYGELAGVFERLFILFWENYLQKTRDMEILEVIQPFYVWRSLFAASPTWYPNLARDVRIKLLNFAKNVLEVERFDMNKVNSYIGLA